MKNAHCEFCREKDRIFGLLVGVGFLAWMFFGAIIFDFAHHVAIHYLGL